MSQSQPLFRNVSLIASLCLGGVMIFSNPDQNSYLSYASKQVCRNAEGGMLTLCQGFLMISQPMIQQAIDATTKRQNFIFFSLYMTNLPGDIKFTTIGVLGNFITFKS